MEVKANLQAMIMQLESKMAETYAEEKASNKADHRALVQEAKETRLEAAHFKKEKALNDYYVGNVEMMDGIPIVGKIGSTVLTAGHDDQMALGLFSLPVTGTLGLGLMGASTAREAIKDEYRDDA